MGKGGGRASFSREDSFASPLYKSWTGEGWGAVASFSRENSSAASPPYKSWTGEEGGFLHPYCVNIAYCVK